MSAWLRFTLAVLATWRVTHLLAREDGPADLIVRLRVALGQSWAGKLLDCFYCLSLGIAAPAALFMSRGLPHDVSQEPSRGAEWLFTWLAISGGACLAERAFPERLAAHVEPLQDVHQGDTEHVLRTETILGQQPHDSPTRCPGPSATEPEHCADESAVAVPCR